MGDAERVRHERRLRAAVLAGDESAWREWYDGCYTHVAAYVRWRCGGRRDLADDVLQDTWMTTVRRIATFDPDAGAFRAWVCGVAARVLLNHLRKARRASGQSPLTAEPAAPETVDGESGLRTAETLAELNPRYERALRAKYFDGQSVGAMAEEWGETVKAVESVLSRAREAFRETYERLGRANG